MDRPEHLMIALPSRDVVRASVLSHLFLCMLNGAFYWKRRHGGDTPITYFFQARSHIVEARTLAVEHAREADIDWILWLDDDMAPPADLLERLHMTGKRFVGAVAYKREPPHEPCVQRFVGDHTQIRGEFFDPDPSLPVVEADGTGFACLLMHRSVWEAVWERTEGRPFQYRVGMGEDIYFCMRAKEAGVQLYVVPSCVVGHVTDVVIGREHREHALRDHL
jgi:GT2 family glycosyltransferase